MRRPEQEVGHGDEQGAVPAGPGRCSSSRRLRIAEGCEGLVAAGDGSKASPARVAGQWHSEFRRQGRLYFHAAPAATSAAWSAAPSSSPASCRCPVVPGHAPDDAGKNNVSALDSSATWACRTDGLVVLKLKLMEVRMQREQWRMLTALEIDDAYLGGEIQGGKAGAARQQGAFWRPCRPPSRASPCWFACPASFTKESIRPSPRRRWLRRRPSFRRPGVLHVVQGPASCTSRTSPAAAWPAPSTVVLGRQHGAGHRRPHWPAPITPSTSTSTPSISRPSAVPVQPSLRPALDPLRLARAATTTSRTRSRPCAR